MALDGTSFKQICASTLPYIPVWRHEEVVNQIIKVFTDGGVSIDTIKSVSMRNMPNFQGVQFDPTKMQDYCSKFGKQWDDGKRFGMTLPT